MKVLVFQSHPRNAPPWIRRCAASVRGWTRQQDWQYRLLGDELFRGIPLAITLKAQSRLPLADLGRLLWTKRLLKDWDRVVWIDSDVLVFNPESFLIDLSQEHLVCREILIARGRGGGKLTAAKAYNPTVLMFSRQSAFLDEWLRGIERKASASKGLGDPDFGRDLLRRLSPRGGLPAVFSVGHFNAAILKEIHGHPGPAIGRMMEASGVPFAAANLCGHHKLPDETYLRIIDRLLESGGAVVNDHLPGKVKGEPA
jgi:hypothetical protein